MPGVDTRIPFYVDVPSNETVTVTNTGNVPVYYQVVEGGGTSISQTVYDGSILPGVPQTFTGQVYLLAADVAALVDLQYTDVVPESGTVTNITNVTQVLGSAPSVTDVDGRTGSVVIGPADVRAAGAVMSIDGRQGGDVTLLPSDISGLLQAAFISAFGQPGTNAVLGWNGSAWAPTVIGTPTGNAPVNTGLPTITGTTTSGQTLTVGNGTWSNTPTSYAYQWYRNTTSAAGRAIVQSKPLPFNTGASTLALTLPAAPSTANTLVVLLKVDGTNVTSITGGGATWTQRASVQITGTGLLQIWDCAAPDGTATVTIHCTGNPTSGEATVVEAPLGAFDKSFSNGTSTGATSFTVGPLTPSTPNESFFALLATQGISATLSGGIFSTFDTFGSGGDGYGAAVYGVASDGVAQSVAGSQANHPANAYNGVMVAYKPPAGAGSGGTTTTAISGATSATYVLTTADVGNTVQATVIATNATGSSPAATSAATAAIAPAAGVPTIVAEAASGIATTGATLRASVNPNGSATSVVFNWGLTTGYGTTTSSQNIGSGGSAVEVTQAISGLAPGTVYHYRAVASY